MRSLTAAVALLPLVLAMPSKNVAARDNTKPGYTGDITHYDVGLGSCGQTNTDSDMVVALSLPMMANGANPNTNPLCGQTITIDYNGAQHQATIVDSCQACAFPDVDMSPALFQAVAPNGNGRVHNVHWWFDSTADGTRPSS